MRKYVLVLVGMVCLMVARGATSASAQIIVGGPGPAPAPIGGGSSSVAGGGSAVSGAILGGIGTYLAYRAVVCAYKAQKYGTTFSSNRGYEVRGRGRHGCNNDAYVGTRAYTRLKKCDLKGSRRARCRKRARRSGRVAKPWAPFAGM